MAFATRVDKQGHHYGKPLMEALLSHLDATGEGCYLETLKAENVALYKRFSFELKEQALTQLGNLTLYAMHRPRGVIYLLTPIVIQRSLATKDLVYIYV